MFSTLMNPNILAGGLLLALIQILAALPWLYALDSASFRKIWKNPISLLYAIGAVIGVGLGFALLLGYRSDSSGLVNLGRSYASVLHLQILVDLFIYVPLLLTVLMPKLGAVALAAYREAWRQPMFWLIISGAKTLIGFAVVLPYFTFGDDFKMMKQIGYDIIMLAAILFGILAASISISEEIEGRTALTVMSKPVNRRQFLLGKFTGIMMACAAMCLMLTVTFNWALIAQVEYDQINKDTAIDPMVEEAKSIVAPLFQKVMPNGPARGIAGGAGLWFGETLGNSIGVFLGFGQVMILLAVTTALATRLPFITNLVICLFLYFLGHLAPVIVRVTEQMSDKQSSAIGLVSFFGNVFDTLLPALEFFSVGPAIIRESPLGVVSFLLYVLTVNGYALIYTTIALLIGLLLFEDRDLA
ncbi:MAG: ABC transporter permease [Fimbriiglobus sp.]